MVVRFPPNGSSGPAGDVGQASEGPAKNGSAPGAGRNASLEKTADFLGDRLALKVRGLSLRRVPLRGTGWSRNPTSLGEKPGSKGKATYGAVQFG